jgi:anaerobic magnesium-protoporphyrin IX monomethyl ester cyclase
MARNPKRNTVLLFHPRTFHEQNYRYFYLPYSLLSLATTITKPFEIVVVDNNVLRLTTFEATLEPLRDRLLCVGVSSMIGQQIHDGLGFSRAVRAFDPTVPIVWGGALPTVLPQETITRPEIDIIVSGQGQLTLLDLLRCFATDGNLANVPGITYKKDTTTTSNLARMFTDLNEFSAYSSLYSLVNVPDYIRDDEHINSRTINYHSSQGCPFSCGFCSEVALWKRRWTGLSADRVVADIRYLVANYGVNGIKFYDAEFFINQKRVLDIAEGLISHNLNIRWGAAVHPANVDRLSDEQLMTLRTSGAARFLMGAESGVEEELMLIGKRTSRDMLIRIAERCANHGITASFSFVVGYPGMPEANIERTLEFADRLSEVDPRHEAKVHFFAPYPGTPLYPLAVESGFVPPSTLEAWADYDYYEVTTSWVGQKWAPVVRSFNEERYPYLGTGENGTSEKHEEVCPLL